MKKLQDTLVYKMMMIKTKIQDTSRAEFQELGITKENFITMYIIYEHPGITQAEVAELNHKDRNVITKFIDKLEKRQFVRRVQSPVDRRSYCLYLTEAGEAIVPQYWNVVTEAEKRWMDRLTEEEQTQLHTLLNKLMD